jgi:hypothetical protein
MNMPKEAKGNSLPIFTEILTNGGIQILRSKDVFRDLSARYDIPGSEIRYIDFNRTGVRMPQGEIAPGLRVRFVATVDTFGTKSTWFALPVRSDFDSNYSMHDGNLFFGDEIIGKVDKTEFDTCDVSYQRGPHLLNLNSRNREACGGCKACTHSYKGIYPMEPQVSLVTEDQLRDFFEVKQESGLDMASLQQIAVVTGLFGDENKVVEHMRLIETVVEPMGFKGELMYFGCEVNSKEALSELSSIENFALVYAVDTFSDRANLLNPKKSKNSLDTARTTLELAQNMGIETTFSYIAGLDSLAQMQDGFKLLLPSVTRFPLVNIYQIQTPGQLAIINNDAKKLEYYVQARIMLEDMLKDTLLRPRRWENYRPLWYDTFAGEMLPSNAFGE